MALVELTADADAQFHALPRGIRPRVLRLFERLEGWPDVSGAKPLAGKLAGHWRMRTGDYRIQFHPRRDVAGEGGWRVRVEKVGHRDGFYDGDD